MTNHLPNQNTKAFGKLLFTPLHLTVVLFAPLCWYLVRDPKSWKSFLTVEIWYWWFSLRKQSTGRLRGWLQEVEWQPVSSSILLAGAVFWFVIEAKRITFRTFVFRAPEQWEIGALMWTLVFTIASFVGSLRSLIGSTKISGRTLIWTFVTGGLVLNGSVFTYLALQALAQGLERHHLWFVLMIAFSYMVANVLTYKKVADKNRRRRHLHTALYADFPTVIALTALLVLAHPEHMSIFWSGAIAFQFIICFVVSALAEGGIAEAIIAYEKHKNRRISQSRRALQKSAPSNSLGNAASAAAAASGTTIPMGIVTQKNL